MTEHRCGRCGYGVATTCLPPACPMCRGAAWTPVAPRREPVAVTHHGAAGALITVTRELAPRDLGALATTVAELAHDTPEIVVDLTRVGGLSTGAAQLLLRLGALARGAGGHLRARCAAGMRPTDVVEVEIGRGRALVDLDGPVGRAFRRVDAG